MKLYKALEDTMNGFQSFILEHKDNPVLWIGLFAIGFFTYKVISYSLQKEK